MNFQLFKKTGRCENCKEKDCELEAVVINGKEKEFCDACAEGWRIEEEDVKL